MCIANSCSLFVHVSSQCIMITNTTFDFSNLLVNVEINIMFSRVFLWYSGWLLGHCYVFV